MQVIAHDPFLPPHVAEAIDVPLLSLDEVYAVADYLTLHALVTDETRGMINAGAIAKMKAGVRIINAARGALINAAELAEALGSGQVAGAALDVYETEPPPAEHPLIGLPNVIHTPHLAASTSDAQVTVAVEARAAGGGLPAGWRGGECVQWGCVANVRPLGPSIDSGREAFAGVVTEKLCAEFTELNECTEGANGRFGETALQRRIQWVFADK